MTLGENILKLRKKQGLSQEQLGYQIDVTRQTISNWESEDTAPNPEQLKRLSKVFDISIDELLDNEYKSKEILINKVSNTEKTSWYDYKNTESIWNYSYFIFNFCSCCIDWIIYL